MKPEARPHENFSADIVRRMADNIINRINETEYEDLVNTIKLCSNKGMYVYVHPNPIADVNKVKLEQLGFKVTIKEGVIVSTTTISWEKKA